MAVRSVRAVSAPPTATVKIPDTDLTVEQLDEWRKWQKREEKVQGVIRTTVSDGIVIDLLDMKSAKQMWDHILATHQLDSPGKPAQVRDGLASIRLKEDPSAEEMEVHLERFNFLLRRARPQVSRLMRQKGLNDSWQRCTARGEHVLDVCHPHLSLCRIRDHQEGSDGNVPFLFV
jgi:hypothetical protein